MYDIDELLDRLEEDKEYYELGGVEITEEDAEYALTLIRGGLSVDDAIDKVLEDIKECLSNDDEDDYDED